METVKGCHWAFCPNVGQNDGNYCAAHQPYADAIYIGMGEQVVRDVERYIAFHYGVGIADVKLTKVWLNPTEDEHNHTDACVELSRKWWGKIAPHVGDCQIVYFDYLAHDCANKECVARYLVEYMYSDEWGGTLHVSDCNMVGIRQD